MLSTFTIPSFVTVNMGTTTLYDTITIWVDNAHCEGPAQTVIEVQPRHTITPGSDTTVCAEADVTFIHTLGGGAQNVSVVWEGNNNGNLIAIVDNGVVTFTGAPLFKVLILLH
jgi:hypothetical protein